jgi:hypothetical protein
MIPAADYADELANVRMSQMQRELWQPRVEEQIAAAETLLCGPIPLATRAVVRSFHEALTAERITR